MNVVTFGKKDTVKSDQVGIKNPKSHKSQRKDKESKSCISNMNGLKTTV